MTPRIFAFVLHKNGVLDDSTAELAAAAKKIDADAVPTAIVTGFGNALENVCANLAGAFKEVWKVSNETLAYPNAELVRQAIVKTVPTGSIVLIAHDHFGMDLGPGLSVNMDAAFVSDALDLKRLNETTIEAVRQEFGGQVSAHVRCDISRGAVINIRPGSFKATQSDALNGQITDKSPQVGNLTSKRRYCETVVAEAGDVDITKHAILVSVGRGIQEQDNISLAEDLAEALGAAVSCSRPVVDAKWLAKSRQVGSSGKTVKPKVYLACGISGAFQHLAGLKGSPFIIAINKNPKAPIFQVADVGIVDDLLELLPEFTTKVRELQLVAH